MDLRLNAGYERLERKDEGSQRSWLLSFQEVGLDHSSVDFL